MTEIDVFVGNHTIIDPDIYDLWLKGLSVTEAATILKRQGVLHQFQATMDDLLSDINDHFRLFSSLEKLLKDPPKFQDQQVHQIDPDTQRLLIERYYQFDSCVVREILGKKLNSRQRKDLDDVSEKTEVPLRSCRRQFDNVKRVFKTVEELMGSLVENIKTHYLLSDELAKSYAAIVFITNNRFETGKKKLGYLSFEDFATCADHMIANWSYSSDECTSHEDMDVDLDRNFLLQLRDLKVLTEKDTMDEHKNLVLKALSGQVSDSILQDVDSTFRNFSKTIVNIAYGLNHSREAKDIFLDLYEKLIEPCLQNTWTKTDLQTVMIAYKETSAAFCTEGQSHLLAVCERYMNTLTSCAVQIFPLVPTLTTRSSLRGTFS